MTYLKERKPQNEKRTFIYSGSWTWLCILRNGHFCIYLFNQVYQGVCVRGFNYIGRSDAYLCQPSLACDDVMVSFDWFFMMSSHSKDGWP